MVKWKWSLTSGRCAPAFSWSTEPLGADEHGVWLGASCGNDVLQPDGRIEQQTRDTVWLIPHDRQWWLAAFWDGAEYPCTIDICKPAERLGTTWSFVDLELDLRRAVGGQAEIIDHEEFDALAEAQLTTREEIVSARTAADQLLPLLQQQAEPFGRASHARLHHVLSR